MVVSPPVVLQPFLGCLMVVSLPHKTEIVDYRATVETQQATMVAEMRGSNPATHPNYFK